MSDCPSFLLIAVKVEDGDDADMTSALFSAVWFPDGSCPCQTAALAIAGLPDVSGFLCCFAIDRRGAPTG